MKTWEKMVVETQGGNPESFGGLVRQFQDMAVGYAYSVLGDFGLAEDAAQEAFIQAYRDLPSLREPRAFPAWFRRLIFTQCARMIRGKRIVTVPMDAAALEAPSRKPTPAQAVQRREMQEAVLQAIRDLPENEREVTTLFYINGYSMAEVGEFLEAPVATVKRRLHSARSKLRERMTDMVEKTLKQNAPGDDFAEKVQKTIAGVPELDWRKGKLCTAWGAAEAATAVTEHPCKYSDLMGFSGVAFRLRWSNRDTATGWCGSCCIGELPEEAGAMMKATGWSLPCDAQWGNPHPDFDAIWNRIVASIGAGRPVIAYDDHLDMAVIYGYEEEGRMLLFRDYYRGNALHALPVEKIGPMQWYLGNFRAPLPPREALIESLKIAVRNWRRGKDSGGLPGREYWYGDDAFRVWIEDLSRADAGEFPDKDMGGFFYLNAWVFHSLADARNAAKEFLKDHLSLLKGDKRKALERAVALYEKELDIFGSVDPNSPLFSGSAFFGPPSGRPITDWTSEVREREREILTKARELENCAITEIAKALS
jgi:RNA polymerase sigma factor (sigma-70 family)